MHRAVAGNLNLAPFTRMRDNTSLLASVYLTLSICAGPQGNITMHLQELHCDNILDVLSSIKEAKALTWMP